MNNNDTINILNGQAMLDYFKKHKLDCNGVFAPFNEAMCEGETARDVFSMEFVESRCITHNVTSEKYNEITLLPLKALFQNKFSNINLWFDEDMFCQINLLTILAYLDQINFSGKTTFVLVDYEFNVVDSIEIDVQGYGELYEEVMVNRNIPHDIKLSLMENGVKLYFEYLKEENEITEYIRQRPDLHSDVLVRELLKEFQPYGLGDTQYFQLIRKCRNRN